MEFNSALNGEWYVGLKFICGEFGLWLCTYSINVYKYLLNISGDEEKVWVFV